jgi:Holliday junction resolvase
MVRTGHAGTNLKNRLALCKAMSHKSRGTNAERDHIHKFWARGWAALRAAGSGSSQYPSPDIVASNNVRKLAVEVKLTTEKKKYFLAQEIKELQYFSEKFGAEAWVAVKFYHQPWRFVSVEDLEQTGSSLAVSLELAERKGLSFEELVEL